MAKMRIFELARELVEKVLAKDSKTLNTDIINFLLKNGVEVKSHQSGVSDEDADKVRDFYSKKKVPKNPIKRKSRMLQQKPK